MLPSTGYFKGINCPFYDSGLCERPYCHFRHSKKESQNVNGDGIESGTILQKLVSAAVQKVLQQTEPPVSVAISKNVDTNVVNKVSQNLPKATYNPTPISELNKLNTPDSESNEDINDQRKRHIPVPYTPRKPTSLPIKRPVENEEASKPFIFIPPAVKYKPGCSNTVPLDQYTPKGTTESNNVYVPGTDVELQEYAPKEIHSVNKINYIPSEKNSTNKKKILEYKPSKVTLTQESSSVTYQPTPRSLAPCFSSDEDEPDTKKQKISDLNGLDDLGPEFDILDQILDEEKSNQELKGIKKKDESCELLINNKEEKNSSNNKEIVKVCSNKENKEKEEKRQSYKKEKHKKNTDNKKHEKYNSKSENSSTNKSDHKIKHKKDERIEKHKTDKKSQSSSKSDSKYDKTKSKDHKKKSDRHSSSKNSNKDKKDNKSSKSNSKSKLKSKDKVFTHNKIDNDNDSVSLLQNEMLSESDEESIAMECKKIFEEYVPTEKVDDVEDKVLTMEENSESEYIPGKVRISRTVNKNIKILPKPASKPNYKAIAAQTMTERLSKIKDYHASKDTLTSVNNGNTTNKLDNTRSLFNIPSNSKIRIAHVPYASTLLNAKKGISSNTNEVKSTPSTSSTIIQSVKKGSQRIAHIPNEKFIDRPGVLEPLASKIPPNIRSTYLNMMIDECLKIYLSATDAYGRAQHEELSTSKKCSSVNIYKNSAVLAVSRLRKELQECKGVRKSGTDFSTLKKNSSDTLPKSCNGSWSIEHKKYSDNTTEFKGARFYHNIAKWILSEEQLRENGFPRPHSNGEKGRALIYVQKKQIPPKGYIRTCCRCKKNFTVDKKGLPVVKEDCIYHPNNKYRLRGEVKYQCCSQDGTSDGCCTASTHVYEYIDYDNLKGFVRTLPPETEMDDYGIYSLDCEMCYTTHGLDLTRITIINSDCKVIYETLIKPLHPIIDYNTRYSGITEEHMEKVKTTLLEVQATLLTLFNSKTILVGHSLESDFKALKLIHDTVVDTSVLFPHKMGPPYKRALRNLSSEHLRKIIQNSVDGHDSAEDATVCMELLHYKLREYLKTR